MKKRVLSILLTGLLVQGSVLPVMAAETADMENGFESAQTAVISEESGESAALEEIPDTFEAEITEETAADETVEIAAETEPETDGNAVTGEDTEGTEEIQSETADSAASAEVLDEMFQAAGETTTGIVEINEENFPDEDFRSYVENLDEDGDGFFSEEEISSITEIVIEEEGITSLEGIEKFTALTTLDCSWNQLTSLDVSKNTKLEYLYCRGNQLTSLDVSKNTELKKLKCGENQLTSLDVSKNTELEYLGCYSNQLTSLDVSKNTALTDLACDDNQLTSLDVSKNTALTDLGCADNQLTSLDVSKNTELLFLFCADNQLTSLDVSKNTKLGHLLCYSNQLTSLDVSKNTELKDLVCDNNQLTSLDVSKNTELLFWVCSGGPYEIKTTKGKFDLSSLPGNFDVNKASNWNGGSVSGGILYVWSSDITYTYDCGNGETADFTLHVSEDQELHTHTTKTTTTKATLKKNGSITTACTVCKAVTKEQIIYYPKTIRLSKTSYTYNGKAQKPSVSVKDAAGKTISSKNYSVKYASGRKNVGKYTVKVTFKGNYSGTKTLSFTINPKGTSLSKVKAGKKSFTVSWKKQTSQTTGYQIQYSLKKNFASAKTVTVKNNKTASKAITGLKAKKKYYVRIRTYKTAGGKTYTSSWSKAKTVTTSK